MYLSTPRSSPSLALALAGLGSARLGRIFRVTTTAVVKEGGKETKEPEALGLICNVAIVQHEGVLQTRWVVVVVVWWGGGREGTIDSTFSCCVVLFLLISLSNFFLFFLFAVVVVVVLPMGQCLGFHSCGRAGGRAGGHLKLGSMCTCICICVCIRP